MVVSGGDCNVKQGLRSSAMLSWIFTPFFDMTDQLQKLCIGYNVPIRANKTGREELFFYVCSHAHDRRKQNPFLFSYFYYLELDSYKKKKKKKKKRFLFHNPEQWAASVSTRTQCH